MLQRLWLSNTAERVALDLANEVIDPGNQPAVGLLPARSVCQGVWGVSSYAGEEGDAGGAIEGMLFCLTEGLRRKERSQP